MSCQTFASLLPEIVFTPFAQFAYFCTFWWKLYFLAVEINLPLECPLIVVCNCRTRSCVPRPGWRSCRGLQTQI